MPRDTSPDPEFEPEPESLPPLGPLPLDDLPPGSDWGPRLSDGPPREDYGIPGIELDQSGRFKVPKLKSRGPQADDCLLEQARTEFFMGMDLDVPTPIAWLWPERIPIGKLTLIEGESNSGTTFLMIDMAARVSSGSPWPGTSVARPADLPPVSAEPANSPVSLSRPGRHVLFVNGGENTGDTLTPRLINGRANLADLTILSVIDIRDPAEMRKGKAETNRRLSLPADLGHIEYQVRQRPDTRLVVVDSLSDFCQTDKQYRDTLRGLHEMAERCQVAIVATARPKNDRRARSKLTPSADRRSESVRCVLNVLIDPHDRSQRYLAPARMNFCREPQWLPFRIGEGVVEWGQPLETAPAYERHSPAAQEKRTLLHEAMESLDNTLADCDLPAAIAIRQMMSCGFSKGTIIRARRELGARSYRQGYGECGTWYWSVKKEGEEPEAGEDEKNGTGENGHGENGDGDEAVGQIRSQGTDRQDEWEPTLAEEFAGVDFERMPRALVLAALNRLQALEAATMGRPSKNGKPGKNGKPSKNGKRKPR
jgi:hypothetical protein